MKLITTYKEAYGLLQETQPKFGPVQKQGQWAQIGIDIGKQFGTRIVMHISHDTAFHLLRELEKRDLPCPQVIYAGRKILIGADPE